jgi:hypothetical protein
MDQHLRELADYALGKSVEEISRRSEWPVYEHYEIIFDEAGKRYIWAPQSRDGAINQVKERLRPLSRVAADVFLQFAHWVENPGMDQALDTQRNAEAAKSWAERFGVLGLNEPDVEILSPVSSRQVTADYLGMPWLPDAGRARLNSGHGGKPYESVENFTLEAWEAYLVLRLYKSVRSQKVVDAPSVIRLMSTFDHGERMPQANDRGELVIVRAPRVERDIYSQDPELTRRWTLTIIEGAVNRKVAGHCYPIVRGAPGYYEPGWGFTSLLGAMWLQMMFLMQADRRCRYCGNPIDPGRRSHAKYCDNDGKCRADYAYHFGGRKEIEEQKRRRGSPNSGSSKVT